MAVRFRTILILLNLVQFLVLLLILESRLEEQQQQASLNATRNIAVSPLSLTAGHHRPLSTIETSAFVFLHNARNNKWKPNLQDISDPDSHTSLLNQLESIARTESHIPAPTPKHPNVQRIDFLAFIRIPKTGSTTLLDLLRCHTKNLYTQDVFIKSDYTDSPELSDNAYSALSCIFASKQEPVPDYNKNDSLDECSHLLLGGTMKLVAESLPYLKQLPQKADKHQQQDPEVTVVAVHPFTMVRDPFDRLVSFFHYQYARRDENTWQKRFSSEQIRKMLDNDLAGWLQLIYEQHTMDKVAMLNQKLYFSSHLDIAIDLVKKGRILTLVQECFDVSVKLLAELYPQQFLADGPEQIQAFLDRGEAEHSNVNAEVKESRNTELRAEQIQALRHQAMTKWFPDQFRLHRVIVQKFRQQVKAVVETSPVGFLKRTEADQCFQKLDQMYPSH